MSAVPESLAAIAVPAPSLPVDRIAGEVERQFGLRGEYSPLVSERDQNFRLVSGDDESFVVKVVSSADSVTTTEYQIEVLRLLETRGVSGVPRIVRTVGGNTRGVIECDSGDDLMLRIVSWVDGTSRRDDAANEKSAASLGQKIAELDNALEDFRHPGENQVLLWDTQRAAELGALVQFIDDVDIRRNVELALADFQSRALPRLNDLPTQTIHNDINGENVLYDGEKVCGIIDFGDLLRAPRVIEVATAAAYLRSPEQPLRLIAPMVSAYCAVNPLVSDELDLLFDLVRARLCMTVSILHWRLSARDPDDPYRQKSLASEASAAPFLASLNKLGREEFVKGLR